MLQKESPKENSQNAVFIDPDVLPFIDLDDRKRVNVINPVLTKTRYNIEGSLER